MKMVMFSNLRRFRPFAVAGMVLLGSLLLITSNMLSTTVSAAVTESQCYDLNGKTYNTNIPNTNRQAQTECIAAGYCKEVKSGNVAGVTSCSRTIYETSDQYKASQAASESGQVQVATMAPAQRVICGGLPTNAQLQDEYNSCASTFQSHYTQCTDNAERRYSPAEDQVTAAIATCLAGYYPSANSDNLTAAVTQGRADGTTKAEEIAADKVAAAQAVCAEKKMTYSPNTEGADTDGCITTAAQSATCAGGALGWLLCPVMKIFESINSFMAQQIENQLVVGPLTESNPMYLGTHPIWESMVGIANLLLVVAFLIVIFSQATSMGLSAYGIKKMLPRIIAAAILINLSYFICTIAIDIANVIGASVHGIIDAGGSALKVNGGGSSNFGDWLLQIGGIVLGGAAIVLTGAIGYLVPLAIAGTMATIVVFLGLAIRKIIIVLLIIVAPLAFAAMILPGTEGLFKKWQKSLMGLLIMYPVIMAILYGSVLVSNIILVQDPAAKVTISSTGASVGGQTIPSSSEGATTTANVSNANIVTILLAYAVVAIGPFVGTYMFIKNSSKIFGAVAGMANRAGAGAKKWGQGFAKEKYDRSTFGTARAARKNAENVAAQQRAITRLGEGGRFEKLGRAGLFGKARKTYGTQMASMNQKIYDEELKAENFRNSRGLAGTSLDGAVAHLNKLVDGGKASDIELHSAVETLLSHKGGKSNLAAMYRDTDFMKKLYATGGDDGFVRGSLANSGFVNAHSDVANALTQHGQLFKELSTQADSTGAKGKNGETLNKANEYLLGDNFVKGTQLRDATGHGVTTTDKNGNTVPVQVANGVRDWNWIAQRAPLLIQASEAHKDRLKPFITYETAVTTQKAQEFGNADPGIQEMINDIVKAGSGYRPPTPPPTP